MTVTFDKTSRSISLSLARSRYVISLTDDDRVIHAGFGPSTGCWTPEQLDLYEAPNYVWNPGGPQYEFPAFGDVAYQDVAIKLSFFPEHPALGKHMPVRDARLRYQSHEVRNDADPALAATHPRKPRKASTPRDTLVIHLKDAVHDFHVRLFYLITPEHDIIQRWTQIENRTEFPVEIESLAFACLPLPPGAYDLIHAAGNWAREFLPVSRPLEQGVISLTQRGLNTGHTSNPFFLVHETGRATEDAGVVYFGALAYSGNWQINAERDPTHAARVIAGYERADFRMTLAPGQTHTTPAMVVGVSADGLGGASRQMHAFARDYVLPGFDDDAPRPVLYNSWEATYFDVTAQGQIRLARAAAQMGVELFCMDDGWFGARRNDRAGLGDWTVSHDQFPEGLAPLINEVKRLGMRFGLWVEPEMVNPDSDLYRAHPDWVLHFPDRPRTEHRQQLILDFGRDEVVQHVFNVLDTLVNENDISFFKWDFNRYATEPGSVAGREIWLKHVEGLYRIIDRLRTRHSKLDIQSCSGGGGRIDLGILQRADQAWTSDNTDAIDRTHIQDGYSLVYPLRAMECWVTHEHNHQTGRHLPLDLRFDVAMRGTLGIGTNIDKLTPYEIDVYKRKIAFYKRIRHIVQNGDLYRLANARDSGVSAWQINSPDATQAVYSIVVTDARQGPHVRPMRLHALLADRRYRATDEYGKTLFTMPGGQLMTLGVPGDTRYGSLNCAVRSRTLHLEAV